MNKLIRYVLRTVMCMGLIIIGEVVMHASDEYYARVQSSANPTGAGSVYISKSSTSSAYTNTDVSKNTNTSGGDLTFYAYYTLNSGYHFKKWMIGESLTAMSELTGYKSTEPSGEWDKTEIEFSVKASTTAAESESKTNAKNYYLQANILPNWYYAKLTVNASSGGTVSPTSDTQHTTTRGGNVTFSQITAIPNTGYHFTGWSGDTTSTTNPISLTKKAATKFDEDSAATYTVTANFAANYYTQVSTAKTPAEGGNAYVKYGSTFSGTATVDTDGNGQGETEYEETYSLKAETADGYYFLGWEVTGGEGNITDASSLSTTIKIKTHTGYQGSSNKYPCTVTAKFKKYEYKAKLTTAVSTALEGSSSGAAQVQNDASSWVTELTKLCETPNTDVNFSVKATPNKGYQFKGWSKSNGSTSYISGLGATGTYKVKSSTTQGETNSDKIYAVFDKGTYTIHFIADSKSGHIVSGSMSDQVFTSGVSQKLNKNAFICNYTVTYDSQGGNCPIASEAKSRFTRWKEWVSGSAVNNYDDEESINRMEVHGTTVNLTATWADKVKFTLPTPTKEKKGVSVQFLGWYDAAEGGNLIGMAGAEVNINTDITLYAHWKEYNITVSTSGTANGRAVFNVTRTGTPSAHYRISVPVGTSKTIKNVIPGEYTVTPEATWNWTNTITPDSIVAAFDSSGDNSQTLLFSFIVNPKETQKKHDEATKVIGY